MRVPGWGMCHAACADRDHGWYLRAVHCTPREARAALPMHACLLLMHVPVDFVGFQGNFVEYWSSNHTAEDISKRIVQEIDTWKLRTNPFG